MTSNKNYPRADVVMLAEIPAELREVKQWVCWRLVERAPGEKPAKVPVNPASKREASVTNPATWAAYDVALEAFRSDQSLAGVGFVFTAADPFCGVDIDDCRDPITGELGGWAAEIVRQLDTYTEVSPSGTGVKLVLKAEPPGPATRRNKIEMYSSARYFTLTGERLPDSPVKVNERQGELADLYVTAFGAPKKPEPEKPKTVQDDPKLKRVRAIDDDDLLKRAREAANGEKFAKLWNGDTDDYGGDRSRADAALAAILCYWTRADAARLDKLFRRSGLIRKKWDERRGTETYGERTISHAIAALTARYDPDLDATLGTVKNDVANAEIFVQLAGGCFAWVSAWRAWLAWDKHRWRRDADSETRRAAEGVSTELLRRASLITGDSDARKATYRWAIAAGDLYRLRALEDIARTRLEVRPSYLDRDPYLLGVGNGVIDLRTGERRDGAPGDWLTRYTAVRYDPAARCPKWDRFLLEIMEGDREMVAYLWRVIGYALTGDTSERAFFLLHGYGRNGKTTFVETLHALLGAYAQRARFATFLRKNVQGGGANDDIAHLAGARVVIASEADQAASLDVALVKELTGTDTVRARFLYGREFEFAPVFKLFLATNHVPQIYESTYAFWDRLHYIEFKYRVPENKVNKKLPLLLLGELEGILAKAVVSCRGWQRDGLQPPAMVLKAGKELQERMDTFGEWKQERCEDVFKTESVSHGDLYMDFSEWMKNRGVKKPPSSKALASYLREKGYCEKRATDNVKIWCGLRLKPR